MDTTCFFPVESLETDVPDEKSTELLLNIFLGI